MRVLTVGTYPIGKPRHGGQVRVSAITKVLSDAGWETDHLAVCPQAFYGDAATELGVFEMSAEFTNMLEHCGRRTDVAASEYIMSTPNVEVQFKQYINASKPDIISIEQPWLWPAVKKYLSKRGSRDRSISIVYSSQNVEYKLLIDEWRIANNNNDVEISRDILCAKEIEEDLAKSANGIMVVSEHDYEYFEQFNSNLLLARNGIWKQSLAGGAKYWQSQFEGQKLALFVGSAHPPNSAGFRNCLLKPSLAFLPPDERIIVAGAVGDLLKRDETFRRFSGVNLARIHDVGVQDVAGLATMYNSAEVLLLPITDGGGTNIKTAEALYSGKRIVATERALRGFEAFLGISGLTVVKEIDSFPVAVRREMARLSPLGRSLREQKLLDGLLWSNSLSGVPEFFARVAPQTVAASPIDRAVKGTSLGRYTGSGWLEPTAGGVCSAKLEAELLLNLPVGEGAFVVNLTFRNYSESPGIKIVSLHLRGEILGFMSFEKDGETIETRVEINSNAVASKAPTVLKVAASSLTERSRLFGKKPEQKMGICLLRMEIERVRRSDIGASTL